MKKAISVLVLVLLFTGLKAQITIIENTGLYKEASLQSKRLKTLYEGEVVTLGDKVGDFYRVKVKKDVGYVHYTCLSNYSKPVVKPTEKSELPESPVINKNFIDSPGNDLIKAGQLLIGGVAVTLGGSLISTLLISSAEDTSTLRTAGYISVGVGILGLVLQVAGYGKLIQAGEKMNISLAKEGVGLAFSIN